jgi:two-component system KDP operon response regulator KdpE
MAVILLADDDPRLLPVLALHLRNDDHQVLCAATVDDVIRVAASSRPDVMVLDLGMTDADGHALHRRVAQEAALAGIPAIYLVDDEAPQAARAPRPNSAATISRPVPTGELLEKVRRVVAGSPARDRAPRPATASRNPARRSAA